MQLVLLVLLMLMLMFILLLLLPRLPGHTICLSAHCAAAGAAAAAAAAYRLIQVGGSVLQWGTPSAFRSPSSVYVVLLLVASFLPLEPFTIAALVRNLFLLGRQPYKTCGLTDCNGRAGDHQHALSGHGVSSECFLICSLHATAPLSLGSFGVTPSVTKLAPPHCCYCY